MPATVQTMRLDPWAAEYEGSIQINQDEEAVPVDLTVEQDAWTAVRPGARKAAPRMAFVDGVRRIEHRVLVGEGQRTIFGLLGSFGVGAVHVHRTAHVDHEVLGRVLVTGGGVTQPPFLARIAGGPPLRFDPRSEPENDPAVPVQGLQKAMRQGEAALAERLSAEADIVFLDGPLTYLAAAARGPVVGFVKRLLRTYLDPSASALLPRLGVGERTPLFLVEGARQPRYSWYTRIGVGRMIDSALTGVVRLEVPAAPGLERARALADLAACMLPRFASDPAHDPRAPQNLFPIGALEARLKHRLGDHAMIRRSIEARLHAEVMA